MAHHNDLGKKGEQLACEFLEEKGHKIIEKNWRYGKLEIDIISFFKNTLYITEVKTRKSDFFGSPEEAVSIQKQKNLFDATNHYLKKKCQYSSYNVCFSIASIILNSNGYKINYIPDAFYPIV